MILQEEAGAAEATQALASADDSYISTVNLTEVLTKLVDRGTALDDAFTAVAKLELQIIPFDEPLARLSAALRRVTRTAGLSLGDRACIATALSRQLTVLTADRVCGRRSIWALK